MMVLFDEWCSHCLIAPTYTEHVRYCLEGVGSFSWWPWSRGIKCECPHSEPGLTAYEVAVRLGIRKPTR